MTRTVRMPMSAAYSRGISAVAASAADERVILTSHGRPVAVVDSPERLDEDLRKVREAARLVTENLADAALDRRPATLNLEDLCSRVGIDPDRVRERTNAHIAAG